MQKFTAREYLKIDIANNYGLDKLDWDERISWFDQNETKLQELIASADEPALFYAGIKAWEDVKAGRPTGYMISLDATSSGLQLLACLTGDNLAARLCNVIDTGHREDAYTAIYQVMLAELGEAAKISRDDVKQAIMTAFYASKAVPKKVFGEGALLDLFYHTLDRVAPAAWELNEAMEAMWNPEALSHDWVLPDNFHVHVKVMHQVKETVHFLNEPFDVYHNINAPTETGRSLGANTIHSIDGMIVREMTRRCDYDPAKVNALRAYIDKFGRPSHGYSTGRENDNMVIALWDHYNRSGYLSARILDYLDLDNLGHVDPLVIAELIASLPQKPFKVVSIHDCFRCHPNYGNDLREQYNLQLMLIARSWLLDYIVGQLVGEPVSLGKLNHKLHEQIMDTNYALS